MDARPLQRAGVAAQNAAAGTHILRMTATNADGRSTQVEAEFRVVAR